MNIFIIPKMSTIDYAIIVTGSFGILMIVWALYDIVKNKR
jgi:hypothetical protein